MAVAGVPLGSSPVITDFPIWLADATGTPALALPDEPIEDVLDLASHFDARLVVIHSTVDEDHGRWPAVLDSGGPGTECFDEVNLGRPADPALAAALGPTRVFRIVCP